MKLNIATTIAAGAVVMGLTASPTHAQIDSVAIRLDPLEAVVDSLAITADSLSTSVDSLAVAGLDSLGVNHLDEPPRSGVDALRALDPPSVGGSMVDWVRPESLEEGLELLGETSIRVAGDRGMASYLAISPTSTRHPEIYLDGIPTRSPADFDPGIWDRSMITVDGLGSSVSYLGVDRSQPHVWLRSRGALDGRTLVLSRFSSTANQSFYRGLSVRTPKAPRELRLDYEEWKTEEGIDYSFAPSVLNSSNRGRSKMRRFSLGTDLETDAGRLRFTFARGRRFHRGDVLSAAAHERWTGELSMRLDKVGESSTSEFGAWHLDFHDDDRILDQDIDASRQGARWQRRPVGGGWGLDLGIERWAARYEVDDPDTVVTPEPSLVTTLGASLQGDPSRGWWPWARLDVANAEHAASEWVLGGSVGLRRRWGPMALIARADRDLRVPTLLETDGFGRLQTVEPLDDSFVYIPLVWDWRSQRDLPIERQDRIGVEMRLGSGRWNLDLGIDQWRLREGIGWTGDPDEGIAVVRGGIEAESWQLHARGLRAWSGSRWNLRVLAQGHRVLGDLDVIAGRGAGWPIWATRVRTGVDREFFSPRNRLGIDVDVDGLGPHRDDGIGNISSLELPALWRVDFRLWLRVRDAEMSITYDNALDTIADEVLGTLRRGRQLRWQLDWPFFN